MSSKILVRLEPSRIYDKLPHMRVKKILVISVVLAAVATIGAWLVYARDNQVLPQSAVDLLAELPAPAPGRTILVFTPHPDDETIAAGGYIFSATRAGAQVWIALVTDGNFHHQKEIRYAEFKKAAAALGVSEDHLIFLGYPDHQLAGQDLSRVRGRFEEIISTIKPEIVITSHPQDHHPDHRVTGELVEAIWRNRDFTLYEFLVHHNLFPHPKGMNPHLYLLPPARMISFGRTWEVFPLSDEVETQKHKAILQYRSQLSDRRDPLLAGLLVGMLRKNELFSVPSK